MRFQRSAKSTQPFLFDPDNSDMSTIQRGPPGEMGGARACRTIEAFEGAERIELGGEAAVTFAMDPEIPLVDVFAHPLAAPLLSSLERGDRGFDREALRAQLCVDDDALSDSLRPGVSPH